MQANAGGDGSGLVQRSQQGDGGHVGIELGCMRTTTGNENNSAASAGADSTEQQVQQQQGGRQQLTTLKVAVAAECDIAGRPLHSSLAQNTSLMPSTCKESDAASRFAGRSWLSVAAAGAAAAVVQGGAERGNAGRPVFSSSVVSSGALQRGDDKKPAQKDTQVLVSIGQVGDAAPQQGGGVTDENGVSRRAPERGNVMLAPSPWSPTQKTGGGSLQVVACSPHDSTHPAGGQAVRPDIGGVSGACRNSMEVCCTSARMGGAKESRREEVPGCRHSMGSRTSSRAGAIGEGSVLDGSGVLSDEISAAVHAPGACSPIGGVGRVGAAWKPCTRGGQHDSSCRRTRDVSEEALAETLGKHEQGTKPTRLHDEYA